MTTRALAFGEQGKPELTEAPMPEWDDDEILIRVRAVGLNPAAIGRDGRPGAGAGAGAAYGYAGSVEEVGGRVTKEFKKGDRVAGVARSVADGAFAEYVVAKGDLQVAIPEGLGNAEAAALGGPLSMVCQGLYGALQLPLPPASWFARQTILIHGGDTAAGRLGIQLARRSGLRVFATARARERDEEALRGLGATAVFDAGAPTCGADVRALSRDRLTMAWDCRGTGAAVCAAALSATEPGAYATSATPGVVRPEHLTTINAQVGGPRESPAAAARAYDVGRPATGGDSDGDAYELVRSFWERVQALLESGELAMAPPVVNRGGEGLEGVVCGLEELRGQRTQGGDEHDGDLQLVYTL